jgi:hypothetical protein
MSKRRGPAPNRDRRVLVPLSAQEFQLIDYAASKSNIRGTLAWMRAKLLEAARAKLTDEVVQDILEGRATMALMRESLGESTRRAETQQEELPAATAGRGAVAGPGERKPRDRARLKLVERAAPPKSGSRSPSRPSRSRSRR